MPILQIRADMRHFWSSVPSRTLSTAIFLDIILVGVISTVGIPGLTPIPLTYTLAIIAYYAFFVFVVNDAVKHILVKRAGLSW